MKPHLINSYSQHKGGTRSLRDSVHLSVDLTLDILNGCEYNCEGCFVSKTNKFDENDLDILLDLILQWDKNGYDINELFLGPVDIFSAVNLDRLMDNEKFQEICSYFTFTCSTTLMSPYEEIKQKYEKLSNTLLSEKRNREFEIFVVIDDKKYLSNDKEYLEKFNKNLELFELYNVFFVVNVYADDMFNETSLEDLNKKIFKDYNSKLRVNPSYFRGTSVRHLERFSTLHKNIIENEISENNIKNVFMNMIDIYFGGFTFNTYSFRNHELYIAPILYEAIPQDFEYFKIDKTYSKYSLNQLDLTQEKLFNTQYEYSKHTSECKNCEFITSCVSRNVLSYMEHRSLTHCFLPKTLFRDASKIIEFENE